MDKGPQGWWIVIAALLFATFRVVATILPLTVGAVRGYFVEGLSIRRCIRLGEYVAIPTPALQTVDQYLGFLFPGNSLLTVSAVAKLVHCYWASKKVLAAAGSVGLLSLPLIACSASPTPTFMPVLFPTIAPQTIQLSDSIDPSVRYPSKAGFSRCAAPTAMPQPTLGPIRPRTGGGTT